MAKANVDEEVELTDRLNSSVPASTADSALTMEALRDECDHLRSLLRAVQASSKDARVGYMMTMSRTIEVLREQVRQKNAELETMSRVLRRAQQIAPREACGSTDDTAEAPSPNPRHPNPPPPPPPLATLECSPSPQPLADAAICDVPTAPSLSGLSAPGNGPSSSSNTAPSSSSTVAKLRMELAAATVKTRKLQGEIDMLQVTKQRLEEQCKLATDSTTALQRRVDVLQSELAAARASESMSVSARGASTVGNPQRNDLDGYSAAAPPPPPPVSQMGRARSLTATATTPPTANNRPPFHRSESQRGASVPSSGSQLSTSKAAVDTTSVLQDLQVLREQLTESRAEVERLRVQLLEREAKVAQITQQWEAESRAAATRETNLKESLDRAHETYEEEITQLNRVLSSWREDQQAIASARSRTRTGGNAAARSPSPTPRATPTVLDAATSPCCSPSEARSSPPPVPLLPLSQNLADVHAECGMLKDRLRHAQERVALLEESRRGLLAELSTIRHVYFLYGAPGSDRLNRSAALGFWPTASQGANSGPPHTMRHPSSSAVPPPFSHSSSWDFDTLPHTRSNTNDSPAPNSAAGPTAALAEARVVGHVGPDGAGARPRCVSPSNSARTDVEESSVSWTMESRLLLRLQDEILSLRQQIEGAQGGTPQRRHVWEADRGPSSAAPTEVAGRSSTYPETLPRGDFIAASGAGGSLVSATNCDPARTQPVVLSDASAFLRQAMVHTAPVAMATVFVFLGALFGAVAARKA